MSTQNPKNKPTPTQARAARRERRQNRRKFTRVFIGLAISGVALLLILGLILPMLGNLGSSAVSRLKNVFPILSDVPLELKYNQFEDLINKADLLIAKLRGLG